MNALSPIEHRPMARWFVVRAATRQEDRAASSLREAGYTVYMPARTVLARHARKTEKRYRPLFVGYMFMQDPGEKGFYAVNGADGVSGMIVVNGKPASVAHSDVASFFWAQLAGAFDETITAKPEPFKPRKGDQVKIVQGPYAGIIGQVRRMEGKDRVALLYSLFGRSGKVTLPVAHLKAA